MRQGPQTILAAATLFIATQWHASAQEADPGSIGGRVTSCAGAPMAGAEVTLSGPPGRGPLVKVRDGNGDFRFGGLPAGTYSLEAMLPGYLVYTRAHLHLPAGGAVTSDVVMAFDPLARMSYEVLRPGLSMDLPTLWRSVDAVVLLRIQKALGVRRTPQSGGPCENIYVEHRASVLEVFRRCRGKPDASDVDFLQAAPAPGYSGMKTVTGNWQGFRPGDEFVTFLQWDASEKAFLAYFTIPVRNGKVESFDLREIESGMKLDDFLKLLRAMME
jgi:hypothetical protein